MSDFLPRAVLLRLLAILAIVLAPHVQRLPLWEVLLVLAIGLWRLLATLRQWRPMPRWIRFALTVGAFVGVYAQFGNVAGQTAGVALLTVMAALKLTELNKRRDVMVMVPLMYFILITHFLFSQEIWTVIYLPLISAVLITSLLVEANHPDSALPLRASLRMGGRLVLHALPLMVVLFLLFPRIPGPLWGLPTDAGAARTGLSDDMSPGEIQNLIESDEVAFRVRFSGAVPPSDEMYWRGPVLAHFDGRRWQAGYRPPGTATAELGIPAYSYEITLEPQRRPWLLALDLPSRTGLPQDATLTADYQLVAGTEVKERRLYQLSSHPALPAADRICRRRSAAIFLQLPRGSNPRTRALAEQWRAQGLDDLAIVKAALDMFRGKDFYYTLRPPVLGRNSVDEFLFDTHRGFCEHYSSSFTVLMRAAGIPARVVTGYQGGEKNDVGDYYLVRQSDAHAWSEVWLAGKGWVRVDPTAAVAPQRVEKGIGAALEGTGDLPAYLDPSRRSYQLRAMLQAQWDWANAEWNRWVLGYGPDLQQEVLGRFGLDDWSDMILALTVAITLILGVLGLGLMRQFLPRREADPVQQLWRKACKRLARAGFSQRPDEGPLDFAGRVTAGRPDLATAMDRVCALYLRLRYLQQPDAAGTAGTGRSGRRRCARDSDCRSRASVCTEISMVGLQADNFAGNATSITASP